jgi:hypothetical protein
MVSDGKLKLPSLGQILAALGIEETAFREFDRHNMRDFNEFVEGSPLFQDNTFSVNSAISQRTQCPLLRETGLKLGDLYNKPFYHNVHDGLYTQDECQLRVQAKNRHLLTFEADLISMVGMGNQPPAELNNFATEFLINRES